MLSLLALALAPSIALSVFFYIRNRYKKAPLWQLAVTFLLGAVVLIPSAVTSMLLQNLTGWTSRTQNLFHSFLGALFIVGMVEEGWKFIVVRFYAYNQPEFVEPYDGILYAVMAALGFATVENILYVLTAGLDTGLLRALLAVPGHAFYGVLMGYFIGEARFAATNTRSDLLSLAGLASAVLAHGVYDFMVFSLQRTPLMLLVLPVFVLLTWVIFFKATRKQAEKSQYKRPQLASLLRRDVTEAEEKKKKSPPG